MLFTKCCTNIDCIHKYFGNNRRKNQLSVTYQLIMLKRLVPSYYTLIFRLDCHQFTHLTSTAEKKLFSLLDVDLFLFHFAHFVVI